MINVMFPTKNDANVVKVVNAGQSGRKNLNVLVASRSKTALDDLAAILAHTPGIILSTRLINNGHSDPLYGLESLPDLLIFRVGDGWQQELEELAARPLDQRRPSLVISSSEGVDVARFAMQAGARDFFAEPFELPELQQAISLIAKDYSVKSTAGLSVFINAKGGSGASLLASNTAHIMAQDNNERVVLVDLDMQFGTLSHYLDLESRHGLEDVIDMADELDGTALEGYMLKHPGGLRLLGSNPKSMTMPDNVSEEQLGYLLSLLESEYDQVVIDVPRQINHVTSAVLERAEKIAVVVQQHIVNVRDAKHLLDILKKDIGVTDDKIILIVNRYQPRANITLLDIEKALQHKPDLTVPNDYRLVSESLESGIPLYDVAKKAGITQACIKLKSCLHGQTVASQQGLFTRLFSL